ncbi:MAG: transferrin-binding protein-like solute binding protein [Neisseriaceae bacterium]|nr:transferrin-binding protein-like solute binding protein [Neisseriaceae bacterium]
MKKTSLLTLVSLLVLSACGGSDGPVIDNTTKPKPEVTDQTGKGFTVHQIVEYDTSSNLNLIAQDMNISHDNYKYQESPNEGKNFNKIEINGKLMDILPAQQRPDHTEVNIPYEGKELKNNKIFQSADSKDSKKVTFQIWGGSVPYARYGIIADNYKNATGKDCNIGGVCSLRMRAFYQGQPTLDMPTTGTALYVGGAVLHILNRNTPTVGVSAFEVDFGKKNIEGAIGAFAGADADKLKRINLKATIQGNAFKSKQMEGKFYGPKAANVAGYFIDKEQNLHGTFGAEKVKK